MDGNELGTGSPERYSKAVTISLNNAHGSIEGSAYLSQGAITRINMSLQRVLFIVTNILCVIVTYDSLQDRRVAGVHAYMMDSTSSTTQCSRSVSPSTPEPSSSLDPIAIQSELDLTSSSSWYLSGMHTTKDNVLPLASDHVYTPQHKTEDDRMLRLDELIEDHAYEE